MRPWSVAVAALAAFAVYGTPSQLAGPLLYDDKAAVQRNPVVNGAAPLSRVWRVDFWGENELDSADSHKSWRPLVTLSFRANFALHDDRSFGYHVVNCALHVLVSALVEPATRLAFGWRSSANGRGVAAGLSALLFAVHPVHVEAVQNIVGRAEIMMSLFYLRSAAHSHACGAHARTRRAHASPRLLTPPHASSCLLTPRAFSPAAAL
jgi:hypothetical protein